ncbi:MAG: TonB family protein [Nitrospirota bacterium]
MRKLFFGLFCIITFVAAVPFKGYSTDLVGEEIKLYLGQPKAISVNSPKRVAIGNPAIADVVNISKTELTITPKAAGDTTLIIWDNFGEQPYRLKVFIEDTSLIKRRVDNMLASLNLPEVYTKAEDEENKVVLLGSVKSAKDKERIGLALAQVKDKIMDLVAVKEEEAVIEIDVQVLEIDSGSQDTLGFTWPGSINITEIFAPGLSSSVASQVGTLDQTNITTTGGTTWGKLFKVGRVARDAYTLKLDALIQEGKARILSRPRLSCQSGKEAKLLVGGEVPILSGSVTPNSSSTTGAGATTNTNVEYKEYGIILNIKPLIEDSGRIHLGLDVSVSEVGAKVETTYALAYPVTKRSAQTELFLDDGQTMAIGGLMKRKSAEDLRKVPWLADLPVLGAFFRQRTTSSGGSSLAREDTELFITLTPHIVSQVKAAKELKPVPVNVPSVSDDDIRDPVLKYSKIVQKLILDDFSYPAEAREAGFQGTVKLSLRLSHQGDLLDSKVKDPSGYQVLDNDALNTAKKASPYPPFSPEIKEKEIWMDIPIIYQLN